MTSSLNSDQQAALSVLNGCDNIFLTGAAGTGKSFLLRQYLRDHNIPILASTGAAAILVGGRTFHSFFGLGIMEGGMGATLKRAIENKWLKKRLKKTNTVIIDEISMISGPTLRAAEMITRTLRGGSAPWGGMRIVAVGDFAQLPPVNPFNKAKEWAFLDEVWTTCGFTPIVLNKIMRTNNSGFMEVLNLIRKGLINDKVTSFLNSRVEFEAEGDFTRLFPHRADVESYNLEKLQKIDSSAQVFKTCYTGNEADVEKFKKHAPIPDIIHLKIGALVMLRQNDPEGHWVNGSLGRIEKFKENYLVIKLNDGQRVDVGRAEFTLLNGDGHPVVTANNFPVTLAWAMTIHKAQGTTLDRMLVDLRKIWEPGQAYVALSRVRSPDGLYVDGWNPEAIFADRQVIDFHQALSTR